MIIFQNINHFIDDFEEMGSLEVTDDVVCSYADFVCSYTCSYSGVLLVSFKTLQDSAHEALNAHIENQAK